ncbi:hypothetical protein EMIHUDRAFT_208009 [Emiliania huxleyi CCMP1516]|uniref:SHSP domain-containing protein n=2 Tax=Emiliania huxleyi TaxID=2903 RepID=A0A0D3JBS2_EMIH1|nr:hypothetical protein EMIHUDRAFT_208009 [Emiliania huxleyi CCMP1516]EOD20957.1 hypothetical protein EMIHUDRAFT_208009 [Emiliania huxleyi CCMP1516]|eukprot:XP_005773386.1 hypothetical protein EMIHUDRAFT_208009 [Emiliania huxleyi CCMP1516]
MPDEPSPAVPPATIRVNRKRMLLTIKVALHHVSPSQIECNTSKTRIELTTTGRRRFALSRRYPNGTECDDAQTSASMQGHVLVVEMPITKLGARRSSERQPPLPSR